MTEKKYKVIYADPPWKYENSLGHNPLYGGFTYGSMSLQSIKALPIRKISDRDCLLFLWATMPMLPAALEVVAAWGFCYRTAAFAWVKLNPSKNGLLFVSTKDIYSGLGWWTNGNVEVCLLGKKGQPRRVAKNVKQVLFAPRGKHSQKPTEARRRIVKLCGDVPKIELFAREKVMGWDAWGNEVESDIELKEECCEEFTK